MARRLQEPFVFAFREGLQQLAMDRRCMGQDYRVLLYLLSVLEWDNRLRFSQTQVAQELGLSRQAVWKAVQHLVEYGILQPGPRLGSLPTYRLTDDLAYYGELVRRRMAQRQAEAQQRLEALAEKLAVGQVLDVTSVSPCTRANASVSAAYAVKTCALTEAGSRSASMATSCSKSRFERKQAVGSGCGVSGGIGSGAGMGPGTMRDSAPGKKHRPRSWPRPRQRLLCGVKVS